MRLWMQAAQERPEGSQKVIVFSTFVEALHILADRLAEAKLGCVMLHGQLPLDERSQVQAPCSHQADNCPTCSEQYHLQPFSVQANIPFALHLLLHCRVFLLGV